MHSQDRACATLCHPVPPPPAARVRHTVSAFFLHVASGPNDSKVRERYHCAANLRVAGVRHGPGRAVVAPLQQQRSCVGKTSIHALHSQHACDAVRVFHFRTTHSPQAYDAKARELGRKTNFSDNQDEEQE